MQPILFKKHLIEKIWGGRDFNTILNIPLPDEKLYGESWELSGENSHISITENGIFAQQSINELIDRHGDQLLGKGLTKKFNSHFPLLVKYLDINDKLSIQVHPDDKYAQKHEKKPGKFESWYVIYASEDAQMILGLKNNVKKKDILENIKSKHLEESFNIVNLKTGDFLNITPGTVHATLKGKVIICEIQQTSDTTYRIYDYDRIYNGKKRELHLKKGIEAINEKNHPKIDNFKTSTSDTNESKSINLTKNQFYTIDKLIINSAYQDEKYKYFKIFSAISGKGKIIHSGQNYEFNTGMTYLIPANLEINIKGKLEILKAYI